MPRYKLTIEYCGAGFSGWQRQIEVRSVQGTIEAALRNFEPGTPTMIAAGRTDAGVHASGQVAHCDLSKEWHPHSLMRAINHFLRPARIAIIAVEPVPDHFSARFDAIARHYIYRIIRRSAPLAIEQGLAWQVPYALDVAAMRLGAAELIGHHDFTTFRSVNCQSKSPVKTLDTLNIEEHGDEVRFDVRARSFLHNQVRSFVGTLEHVGSGKWPPERVGEALRATNRAACGNVAPPQGLYLARVVYPEG